MTQKISYARPGDRLSARYLNRIVDASNLAIDALGPARSKRLPANDSLTPELDENGDGTLDGIGTQVFTETGRTTSSVRVFNPDDSSVYVDVDRIETVSFDSSDGSRITLSFNNA